MQSVPRTALYVVLVQTELIAGVGLSAFYSPCGGMADTGDLKSFAERREGSNPSGGTIFY